MRTAAVARRYARALFALSQEEDILERIQGEFDALARLLEENEALHHALFRPLHPIAQRRAVVAAVCERVEASATFRKFLMFLVDQRRLVDFPGMRREFERLADEAAGRVRAEVVAADALEDAQLERLRSSLAQRTGREVEIEVRVEPELIGGVIARVGGLVFDGSIRTQLDRLRASLMRGH